MIIARGAEVEMLEEIHAELIVFAQQFQDAGADGLRRVQKAPFDGGQWSIKRLQRDAYLHGLYTTLPNALGTFIRIDELYPRNRLVYRSEKHEADLIFRRRGSINAFKETKPYENPGLFPEPQRQYPKRPDADYRQIACIWDLPATDADHHPTSPFPFYIKIAKENTVLGQGQWDGGFFLFDESELIPETAEFDMDDLDWEVDNDEDSEGL